MVQGDYGDVVSHPLSGLEGYISSIRVDNLTRVEGLIHKLKAPAWPSQLFGAPDSARLAQGKRLYEENCAACHASIGRDDLQTPIKVRQVRLKAHGDDAPIGTDPWMACNTFIFQQPQRQLLRPVPTVPRHPSGVGIVGRTSKIADMQVPEVFQIMLGKKGQLADGIAEIIHAIVTGQQTLPGSDSLQAVPAGQLLLAGAAPADSQAQSLAAGEVPTDKSARKDYCLNTEHPFLGYIARPLNGIWATAPYLQQRFGAVAVRPAAAPGATAGHLSTPAATSSIRAGSATSPRPARTTPSFRHPPGRQLQRRPRLRPRVRRKPAPGAARIPQDPVSRPRPHAQ